MLIYTYDSCLEGGLVVLEGPDMVDILKKVNKSLLLKKTKFKLGKISNFLTLLKNLLQ